uniref:Uncharacterized protein n=1 Tax=Anguilla anguilla TaxID=7936 RepID=A0A0E9T5M7_ANGAN
MCVSGRETTDDELFRFLTPSWPLLRLSTLL